MDNIININAEFNLDTLRNQINEAQKIQDGEPFFESLAAVYKVKKELAALEDLIVSIETEAKGLINAKAKALYGSDWQAIKGEHFKITRSRTGEVYAINGKPRNQFLKIKTTVDSHAVARYQLAKGVLPAGIEVNENRGESIRVAIND